MAFEYLVWELLPQDRIERRIERRWLRDIQNSFHLPRDEFIDYFRLSPELVIQVANAIQADLQSERITVLIAIQFYAQGSYQRSVGNQFQFNISQTTSRNIHAVTDAINQRLLRRWRAREKFSVAEQPFEDAIDCTFVHIIVPHEHEDAFINHHGDYSLNVQAHLSDAPLQCIDLDVQYFQIVDSDMKVLSGNINPRYSGAQNNAYMWSVSPIPRACTRQFEYTEQLCKVRNVVEKCCFFSVFKSEFQEPIAHYHENADLINVDEDVVQRESRALTQRIQRQIM
ncbi:hypothetical protein P5V15_007134 [Pogonomyrmex californicus]